MNKNIFWLYTLCILVYAGQGLNGLPGTAWFFYLKETLHFDEQKIMYLGSIIGLAWLIKPVWGFFIDTWILSKKTWIVLSIVISMIMILLLGFVTSLPIIVGSMMFLSLAGAVKDVAVDGMMCQQGKKFKITGRLQACQWGAITIASVLTGFTGGWIADHWDYKVAYLLLLPIFALMIYIASKYKQKMTQKASKVPFWGIMKTLFTDKNLLLVCLFLFLYNLSPSIGTPLTFVQRDEFGWSKTFIGTLGTLGSIASIGGAWLYYHFSKKLNLRTWLYRAVVIGACCSLCYLYYTPITAVLYDICFSFIGMGISLLTLDFMARESKDGYEAIAFALLCSITNLTSTVNGFLGGWLLPIVGLKTLIVISALTSFACLPLIRRLKI